MLSASQMPVSPWPLKGRPRCPGPLSGPWPAHPPCTPKLPSLSLPPYEQILPAMAPPHFSASDLTAKGAASVPFLCHHIEQPSERGRVPGGQEAACALQHLLTLYPAHGCGAVFSVWEGGVPWEPLGDLGAGWGGHACPPPQSVNGPAGLSPPRSPILAAPPAFPTLQPVALAHGHLSCSVSSLAVPAAPPRLSPGVAVSASSLPVSLSPSRWPWSHEGGQKPRVLNYSDH